MLLGSALSALLNLLIIGGIPFLAYFAYGKWMRKRTFSEIAQRAGLERGKAAYIGYCLVLAIACVLLILVWRPPLAPFARVGSPQRPFLGLGLSGTAVVMALLYGIVQTGFTEELLFRGLVAGSLSRRLPLMWANLLQALIFMVPHMLVLRVMPELWPILLLIFVVALFVGWARIESGSIIGPWIVHAAMNVAICLSVAIRSAG
jgi:membrane protease YdiL (CAAX protease family)